MKKKMLRKKNEKKKRKKRSRNWLGYCPTRSRYNELYRDIAVLGVQLAGECVTIQSLYRDRREAWLGVCHNTIVVS